MSGPHLILINGSVHTMDKALPLAEAVAIQGDRILAVGSNDEIQSLAGRDTRVVDAGQGTVLPGFNDAHVHFLAGGFSLSNVNLREAASAQDMAHRLAQYVSQTAKGDWVVGGDWDHESWVSPDSSDVSAALPTRRVIDAVSAQNPVLINRLDGHMALANTLALKLAGVTRETDDPPGGVVVRDPRTGEPTGILKDAAQTLVERVIPPKTSHQKRSAARAASEHAARLGVTSLTDVSADDDIELYQDMHTRGELKTRIYAARSIVSWKLALDVAKQNPRSGGDWVRGGVLKGFSDGSLGSSTALFFEDYSDLPGNRGLLFEQMFPEGIMLERVTAADRLGLQVMIHAIGDEANLRILDLYRAVAAANASRDRRFRIEHAQHLRASEIPRFGQQGIIASMQPYHAADDGRWCERRIGVERSKTAYAFRSLLDTGALLAFGSDWTVAPLDPLPGIKAAVTRQTLDGKHPHGWVPEQKISLDEALRAYTLGSAYAEFSETRKGTITPGKLADLVLLEGDLFQSNPAELDRNRVVMTIVGGAVAFEL